MGELFVQGRVNGLRSGRRKDRKIRRHFDATGGWHTFILKNGHRRIIPAAKIVQLSRHPALPWVLPFAVFIAFLAAQSVAPVPVWLRLVLPLAAIVAFSRPVLSKSPSAPLMSVLLGVAV